MYVSTQLPVSSQKESGKSYKSDILNLSSSETYAASLFGFYFSAFLSSQTNPTALTNEKMQIRKPIMSAAPRP